MEQEAVEELDEGSGGGGLLSSMTTLSSSESGLAGSRPHSAVMRKDVALAW
jgi:hypothetical protein